MRRKYSGMAEGENDSSDEEFDVLDENDPRCKVFYTDPKFQLFLNMQFLKQLLNVKPKTMPEKL